MNLVHNRIKHITMQELNNNIKPEFLKLQSNGVIRFVTLSEIVYLKSDDNYSCCILKDLSEFTIYQTLQNFETIFGHLFFRCHKSYLINTIYIREINKRSHQVILTTGITLPFSRSRAKLLEEKMKIKTSLKYTSFNSIDSGQKDII